MAFKVFGFKANGKMEMLGEKSIDISSYALKIRQSVAITLTDGAISKPTLFVNFSILPAADIA